MIAVAAALLLQRPGVGWHNLGMTQLTDAWRLHHPCCSAGMVLRCWQC